MTRYEPVIGLEVHVELQTASKIFCHSSTAFGGDPNNHVCPVCLGLPGTLPVLNRNVVEAAIMVGLSLNCSVARFCKFDRKHYFYPDLPKNYQISQYDLPIAYDGYLDVEDEDGQPVRIGITRVHMEEDAGKLLHQGTIATTPYSLVDYNRTGVPLLEIVSEPDMRSPQEARAYLDKLKTIIQYTGVSDCRMEEGSLRCDANVSVRVRGSDTFGTKTEIKNMNSFRALQKAVQYEIERQIECLETGERIVQETRTWDETRGVTLSMRSKEEAHDYRYFPEPDLVPIVISPLWIEEITQQLPELPDARCCRYMDAYKLPAYDAGVLTSSKELGNYFEECVSLYPQPKTVSNWLMCELLRLLNDTNSEIGEARVRPAQLAGMLALIDKGTISGKLAKEVFEEMFRTGKDAQAVVKEKGLEQISDEASINAVIEQVIADHPGPVSDYRAGKERALGFMVGQVMKLTRGKANPGLVNRLLKDRLG
ncbi:MAG: Asp-tRNA(Asn)/Glu-tRNA(Gln) amidotransferase subunit GatB [Clostridia bacterium]|nr:Asp-tRNA(Asn)/Glu-tRNA(Gln) amidotransferase subunit GatB [Clostridia bacterium]